MLVPPLFGAYAEIVMLVVEELADVLALMALVKVTVHLNKPVVPP